MKPESECRFFVAKGRHLYIPYRVRATGKTGEACYDCGKEYEP